MLVQALRNAVEIAVGSTLLPRDVGELERKLRLGSGAGRLRTTSGRTRGTSVVVPQPLSTRETP